MSQPSLRSIARQIGLSVATVSLALRDSPRVIETTKQRVRLAAGRAGYQPNPLVRSVMAALRRSAHDSFQGALLAVNFSEDENPVMMPYHREIMAGACARARELGYSLDHCWVGPRQLSLGRLNAIMLTRGVQGVIVMPFAESRDFAGLDWSRLAAVMLDYCLSAPTLHTVLPDHHLSIYRALERLAAAGYSRPGLVLIEDRDERVMYRWSAGYGSFCRKRPAVPTVPILMRRVITRDDFIAWFRSHRPDVVIGHLQSRITRWLRDDGVQIPRDVGFVQLNWTERSGPAAGLDLQPRLLGAAAVESVVAQLQRNDHGIPSSPKTIALAARWVDGPTLRTRRRPATAVRLSSSVQVRL